MFSFSSDVKKDVRDSNQTAGYLTAAVIIAVLVSLIAAAEGSYIMYLKRSQRRTVSRC